MGDSWIEGWMILCESACMGGGGAGVACGVMEAAVRQVRT